MSHIGVLKQFQGHEFCLRGTVADKIFYAIGNNYSFL